MVAMGVTTCGCYGGDNMWLLWGCQRVFVRGDNVWLLTGNNVWLLWG